MEPLFFDHPIHLQERRLVTSHRSKRLAACRQNVDRGDAPLHFHDSSLHAQACLSTNHPNDVRHRCTSSRRHHLRDTVQAVSGYEV